MGTVADARGNPHEIERLPNTGATAVQQDGLAQAGSRQRPQAEFAWPQSLASAGFAL